MQLKTALHPNTAYFITLLCPMPDNFSCQGESAGTQWVKGNTVHNTYSTLSSVQFSTISSKTLLICENNDNVRWWVRFSLWTCLKSLRSTKVEGFLRVLQFPPIGKVDRVGYDKGRVFCLIVNQIIWQHVLCKAT